MWTDISDLHKRLMKTLAPSFFALGLVAGPIWAAQAQPQMPDELTDSVIELLPSDVRDELRNTPSPTPPSPGQTPLISPDEGLAGTPTGPARCRVSPRTLHVDFGTSQDLSSGEPPEQQISLVVSCTSGATFGLGLVHPGQGITDQGQSTASVVLYPTNTDQPTPTPAQLTFYWDGRLLTDSFAESDGYDYWLSLTLRLHAIGDEQTPPTTGGVLSFSDNPPKLKVFLR